MYSKEKLVVTLLDNYDNMIEEIDGVLDGNINRSIFTRIKSEGSLDIITDKFHKINWWDKRIGIKKVLDGVDYPYGIFIPSTPTAEIENRSASIAVDIYDKSIILEQDAVGSTFTLKKGANIVNAIIDVISTTTSGMPTNIFESPKVASTDRSWQAGTPKLDIVNDMLDTIDYYSINVDERGVFFSMPYVNPMNRPLTGDYRDGENCTYLSRFSRTADYFEVPNRAVVVSGDPEEDEVVGTAENTDFDSPFSFQSRGYRWITNRYEGEEVDTVAEAEALARTRLNTASSSVLSINISNVPDGNRLNDLVTFSNSSQDIFMERFTISRQEEDLGVGGLVNTTLRVVEVG